MHKKIIIIDDTFIDRYVAEKVIKRYSFAEQIICFEGGADALEYLLSHKDSPADLPELIFLDIRMPVMDGFDFLKLFNDLPDIIVQSCSIVMLSSSTHLEDQQRAMAHPCVVGFISKPLSEEKLRTFGNSIPDAEYSVATGRSGHS